MSDVNEYFKDNLKTRLNEVMADFLDSDPMTFDESFYGYKDPEPREKSELHIRMAEVAMNEYLKTVLPKQQSFVAYDAKNDEFDQEVRGWTPK